MAGAMKRRDPKRSHVIPIPPGDANWDDAAPGVAEAVSRGDADALRGMARDAGKAAYDAAMDERRRTGVTLRAVDYSHAAALLAAAYLVDRVAVERDMATQAGAYAGPSRAPQWAGKTYKGPTLDRLHK